jgi:HAD superfamily hydrolase (TIGR01509 family)
MTTPSRHGILRHLRGIIFDLDGTLVDSHLDFAAMRRETGFPPGIGLLEHLATLDDPAEREHATAIIYRHEMAGAAMATWMPGARELLERLVARVMPVGIVTRNSRAAVTATARKLALPDVPLVTREEVPPKPDPAGLLTLARRWQLPPAELGYVGDFLYDLQAASNAGMPGILYASDKNLDYAWRADHVFRHFDELGQMLLEDRRD